MLFSAEWQIDLLKISIKGIKVDKKTEKFQTHMIETNFLLQKYIKLFYNREWLLKIRINKFK